MTAAKYSLDYLPLHSLPRFHDEEYRDVPVREAAAMFPAHFTAYEAPDGSTRWQRRATRQQFAQNYGEGDYVRLYSGRTVLSPWYLSLSAADREALENS
jgi:hypothetical protein